MRLLDFCRNHAKIVIYGAGRIGHSAQKLLTDSGITVAAFLVSEFPDRAEIEGTPIFSFSDWLTASTRGKDAGVLVAVSEKYCDEILRIFSANGVSDYFCVNDLSLQELYRCTHPVDPSAFLISRTPVSSVFGFDRGTPIDRYYIDLFLHSESVKIPVAKNTLEVEENTYSRKFFPDGRHDILHYDEGMDLTDTTTLPQEQYDVFICTQVFNFIYDVKAAIRGAHYLLSNGGTLLATVAAQISPVSQYDMERWGHYWGFTTLGIQKLVEETFGCGAVKVVSLGNAMAATAFVQGLSVEDLPDATLLDVNDPNYAITVGVVAKKGH